MLIVGVAVLLAVALPLAVTETDGEGVVLLVAAADGLTLLVVL
jgi:hypothetical protein